MEFVHLQPKQYWACHLFFCWFDEVLLRDLFVVAERILGKRLNDLIPWLDNAIVV